MTSTTGRPRLLPGSDGRAPPAALLGAWLGLALLLAVPLGVLLAYRARFSYDFELAEIPAVAFAAGLALAGAAYLAVVPLAAATVGRGFGASRPLLAIVVLAGLAFRLALFPTNPVLEDDYYRYLWDGAVTASGLNPFAVAPEDAPASDARRRALAEAAPLVLERINHPGLKTIYPPTAQAAFALAHVLAPWSIDGWRLVCLAGEAATLALLFALLGAAGRAPVWAALYWWNPLVIKELVNSAHMEAILMPLVLAALLLAIRARPRAAAGMLALAAAAKVWPLLLAPLLLRPWLGEPRRLAAAGAIMVAILALAAVPIISGGLDETSGFVAYVEAWKTNSAHFAALEGAIARLIETAGAGLPDEAAGRIARALLALGVGAAALALARAPISGADDLLARALLVALALFLLSPAQFPWYAVWYLTLTVFRPGLALLLPTALLPLYYTSFHYLATDAYDVFRDRIVWAIWVPIWAALALALWQHRRRSGEEAQPHA